MGMTPGAIPLSEVLLYHRTFRPEESASERAEFVRFILAMDEVFLEHVALTDRKKRKPKSRTE